MRLLEISRGLQESKLRAFIAARNYEELDAYIARRLGLAEKANDVDWTRWNTVLQAVHNPKHEVTIGLVGKYIDLPDAYLSVVEALKHAGFHHEAKVDIDWIQAEDVEGLLASGRLADLDGLVIPGGFGSRGFEGKIAAAGFAREHDIPCLGLCLGLQAMTVDFARNVMGLVGANSTEMDPTTQHPVIDLMHDQRDVSDKGGTQRLGAFYAILDAESKVHGCYGEPVVSERHRHRWELNATWKPRLEAAGLRCSGMSPDHRLVEFVELDDHPFWIATQAHPELKSRPNRPAPLFRELVGAALERAEGRNPHLFDTRDVAGAVDVRDSLDDGDAAELGVEVGAGESVDPAVD